MARDDYISLGAAADFPALAAHVVELLDATDLTPVDAGSYYGFRFAGRVGHIWGPGADAADAPFVTVPEGLGWAAFDALSADSALSLVLETPDGTILATRPELSVSA